MGPPWMSGPMESGPLGFETSRVRSRMAQGWAPWGWFWDLPGLAPSRMRSGIPQGWALQGQLWDLPGSGPMGTGLGPPWMLGPAGMTGAGPPRFVNSQGQICDLPGPAGTGVGLGSPGPHGESLSWSAQGQGWFQALWGFTQGLALPPGAQAAHRGGAAPWGDPGQAPVPAALAQALAHALLPADPGYGHPPLLSLSFLQSQRIVKYPEWEGTQWKFSSLPWMGLGCRCHLGRRRRRKSASPDSLSPAFLLPPFPPSSLQPSGRGTWPSSTKSLTSLGTSSRLMAPTL